MAFKKCAQCGNHAPKDGFTTAAIIHRMRDPYTGQQFLGKSEFRVCAGTPCAGRLQMAHEG